MHLPHERLTHRFEVSPSSVIGPSQSAVVPFDVITESLRGRELMLVEVTSEQMRNKTEWMPAC